MINHKDEERKMNEDEVLEHALIILVEREMNSELPFESTIENFVKRLRGAATGQNLTKGEY